MHRTLNCWVILVDEMALDQLDGKARFTDTTSTDDDELVFSEELLRGLSCQQKAGATREEAIRATRLMGAGRRKKPRERGLRWK